MRFETREEFVQKALGTYVLMSDGKKLDKQLVFLAYDEDENLHYRSVGQEATRFSFHPGLELHSPALGYANIADFKDDVYVCRNPLRKYKIGVHSGNVNTRFFTGDININLERLDKIQKRSYIPPSEAIRSKIIRGVSLKYAANRNGVFYRDEQIASLVDNTIVFNSESEKYFHGKTLRKLGFTNTFSVANQIILDLNSYEEQYDI